MKTISMLIALALLSGGAIAGPDMGKALTYNGSAGVAWLPVANVVAPPRDFAIWTSGYGGVEVIRITQDGRVFWKGREIESDAEFREAVLDIRQMLQDQRRK